MGWRYGNICTFECRLPKKCQGNFVPRYIFQPIVENIEEGEIRTQLLSETDLALTILDIVSCTPSADMLLDGQSFSSVFASHDQKIWDNVFVENINFRAIISGKYKYIANRLPG